VLLLIVPKLEQWQELSRMWAEEVRLSSSQNILPFFGTRLGTQNRVLLNVSVHTKCTGADIVFDQGVALAMPSLVCFLVILLSLIVYLQGYSLPKLRSPSGLRATRAKVQSLEVTKTVTATKPVKYIVVTGGVISGIGKGVTASSIGVILKMIGVRPTAIKIDPYLNVDAGTMSPSEHGEVFVLDDGSETDLDLGNYERFLDVRLTNDSNLTTGKVYASVIARERRGDYLGKTVQIIPHITNEIIDRIASVSTQSVDDTKLRPDVCIIELGGTIGKCLLAVR
jgi:hypothetical protein